MKKVKRTIVSLVAICAVIMGLQLSTFAANSGSMTVYLPKHRGDLEVSRIAKEYTTNYFTVKITFIGNGTDKVCAWTETPGGVNYSSSTKQIGVGTNNVTYTIVPIVGSNVVLNMDNPVYLEYLVHVDFSWSPN